MMRVFLLIASLFGAASVGLGAYHAHGMEKMLLAKELPPDVITKYLGYVETGVRYQMFHALALLAVAILLGRGPSRLLTAAGVCFVAGVVLFAHPLFLKALDEVSLPWFVIPSGGVVLIAGWLILAVYAVRKPRSA